MGQAEGKECVVHRLVIEGAGFQEGWVQVSGFQVSGSGSWVSGFRFQGPGFQVSGSRVLVSSFKVLGQKISVSNGVCEGISYMPFIVSYTDRSGPWMYRKNDVTLQHDKQKNANEI